MTLQGHAHSVCVGTNGDYIVYRHAQHGERDVIKLVEEADFAISVWHYSMPQQFVMELTFKQVAV